MNFCDLNSRMAKYKFRNYLDDATSGTPAVGVHEKNLPHDLIPLSFKDMMRYAAPDYDQAPEPMQTMDFGNLQGYGGKMRGVGEIEVGIRPQYQQVY